MCNMSSLWRWQQRSFGECLRDGCAARVLSLWIVHPESPCSSRGVDRWCWYSGSHTISHGVERLGTEYMQSEAGLTHNCRFLRQSVNPDACMIECALSVECSRGLSKPEVKIRVFQVSVACPSRRPPGWRCAAHRRAGSAPRISPGGGRFVRPPVAVRCGRWHRAVRRRGPRGRARVVH